MKKSILVMFVFVLLLAGCSQGNKDVVDGDRIKVVSSFTIITDMVNEIGQEKVDVHNLVPTGNDPHEYEPLPQDIKKVTDADVLFYNGMNLEGGENGWFMKLARSVNQKEENIYNLSEGIEPMFLSSHDGKVEEINPHVFSNPKNGIIMAENVLKALVEIDPDNKDFYESNAEVYLAALHDIESRYETGFASIPKEKRFIVTSERAFQYMTAEYDIDEAYIWAIDTEENGTPQQIKSLLEVLKDKEIPYLFVESNVDERPMKTISDETGIPIFPEKVFADEIGKKGDEVDTYFKFLEHNLEVFMKGLQ